ncbi:MAG: alpha/beta hydrolase [Vicinamibacterales bacterium]
MFTAPVAPVSEEFLRIPSGGAHLHACWYRASGSSRGSVLICSADGEERAWTLRPLVHLARLLAGRGYDVMRFEYEGHGESSGAYEDTGVRSRLRDISAALRTLIDRTGRPTATIVGVRLGAALALEATAGEAAITRLVLWEPVLDVESYLRNLFRVNLTTQMVVHKKVVRSGDELVGDVEAGGLVSANGYNLAKTFVSELRPLKPADRLAAFQGPTLILALPPSPIPETRAEVQRLTFRPIWKEPKNDIGTPQNLLAATADWLDRPEGTTRA